MSWTGLPPEVVKEIASFRVETYESVASCCRCGQVLLFRASETRQFCAYDVLDLGEGFAFFCLRCTPRARLPRRLFELCRNASTSA
jgi:hypothetical protein